MATSIPALVNPPLLVWAREESGFAWEPIAKRLNVKPERLLAWEREKPSHQCGRCRRLAALARGGRVGRCPGISVPKVALDQARGVSLLRFPLPVIGVNSNEGAPGARIFTILHELAHIALAFGEEEKSALQETRSNAAWGKVERRSTRGGITPEKPALRRSSANSA